MDRFTRSVVSVIVGLFGLVVAFLVLMPTGCDDRGGVPSWERCTSAMGLPAFSVEDLGLPSTMDILIPLLAGFALAGLTWWLTGLTSKPPSDDDFSD